MLSKEIFWGEENVLYLPPNTIVARHMGLLSPWNVASVTVELNLKFYFILNKYEVTEAQRGFTACPRS